MPKDTKKKATTKKKAAPNKKAVAKKKAPAKKIPAVKKKNAASEKEQLEVVVKELNDVIDFEPALKVGSVDSMKKQIKEEMNEILDKDPLTDETWVILKKLGYKSSEGDKKKAASKVHAKTSGKKGNKSPKTTGKKGTGIIATIQIILEKGKPVSKVQILDQLCKKFPDRERDGMRKTVGMQVPNRMMREKGVKIITNKDGKFFIK